MRGARADESLTPPARAPQAGARLAFAARIR
jgi:hypothetical protein